MLEQFNEGDTEEFPFIEEIWRLISMRKKEKNGAITMSVFKKVQSYVAGDSFGEIALIKNCDRQATIKATSDNCKLATLDKKAYNMILSAAEKERTRKIVNFF